MTAQSERLKAARIAAGFTTAQEAAERLGVKPPTYSAHENGSRGYRADSAERYARAFSTTAEFLLFGRPSAAGNVIQYPEKATSVGHVSEGELTPWNGPRWNHSPDPVAALAPNAEHPTAYRLGRAAPGFCLLAGDIVILDLNRPARSDDLVVVQVYDQVRGNAHTVLRRYLPPYLVTSTSGEPGEITDRDDVAIKGPVVASFRLHDKNDERDTA